MCSDDSGVALFPLCFRLVTAGHVEARSVHAGIGAAIRRVVRAKTASCQMVFARVRASITRPLMNNSYTPEQGNRASNYFIAAAVVMFLVFRLIDTFVRF